MSPRHHRVDVAPAEPDIGKLEIGQALELLPRTAALPPRPEPLG